jgi:hypothetical protein
MATNNNGNLLDSAGNVAVDFVWGNLPLQPNDVRPDTATGRLDFALDNHVIAESGWNGYPLYTPNTDGEYVSGVAYIVVPNVLGLTTVLALDALKDAGYVAANITQTTGVTNTATQPTQINVTSTTAATVTVSGGTTTWPVGTKVTIAAGTGIPTALVGTWTVTGGSGSTLVIAWSATGGNGTGWTVADTGAITPGTRLTGATLTVKTQTVAAGADSIALGTAITTTSWA